MKDTMIEASTPRPHTVGPIDRELIRKYFVPFPKGTIVAILFGITLIGVLVAVGFTPDLRDKYSQPAFWVGIVGLMFVIGGIRGIMKWKMKATDEQMDQWFEEELELVQQQALLKCGIDESECVAKPAAVWGPRVTDTGGAEALMMSGADGVMRYSAVDISVLNFGRDQLLAYQCCYDRTTGNFLAEGTDEYFYTDVVSVSTKTDTSRRSTNITVNGSQKFVQLSTSETFVLTTAGGTSLTVFLTDPALLEPGGVLQPNFADQTVQSVRKMLRDKKRGPTVSPFPSVPPPPVLPIMSPIAPAPVLATGAVPPLAATDPAVRLRRLKQLLDEELITRDEFDRQRSKLLDAL